MNARMARFSVLGCMLGLAMPAACREQGDAGAPRAAATSRPAAGEPGKLSPDMIARNNRGVGLMGKFQYEPARQAFEELVKEQPAWLDAKVNLAIATLNRQREGDEEAALAMLAEVLTADPKHVRASYCTGLLKLYIESPEEALKHFQPVAEADPADPYAAYFTGQCLTRMQRYEEGLEWYGKAIAADPYLRSAYYAASQANRALHRDEEAQRMLDAFQKLDRNPRARMAEFKYSRMGRKGEAQVVGLNAEAVAAAKPGRPAGPLFLDPVPLLEDGDRHAWRKHENASRPVSITACDINGDGAIDIFIADALEDTDGARNAVCINTGDGRFRLDASHPLAKIENVNAALWGDYDNDGLTDVYLCRRGPNMLWRQAAPNAWADVTESTGTADGSLDTVDGAMFDADHDGDLDIFCINADGPNELLNNNLDGTFRPIAKERGIAGDGKGSRQVLPVDLDGDRDLDLIVINNRPPHDVWMNDRLWSYSPAQGFDDFKSAGLRGVVTGDTDADGLVELYSLADGAPDCWKRDARGSWAISPHEHPAFSLPEGDRSRTRPIAAADVAGEGHPAIIWDDATAFAISGNGNHVNHGDALWGNWELVMIGSGEGPAVVGQPNGKAPILWRPGPGRFPFATLAFTGKQVIKDNNQIRSNASGIGTHYAARVDSRWVAGDVLRSSSGPGQSLQPVSIGLGGQKQIDFVAIDWSDGVFQSEIDLEPGTPHLIEETQRQLSSCPVIFAWNGERYGFVTDCLGVGGIGYATGPGEYAPARPWEHVLLPEGAVRPRAGKFIIKLGEPMEEACYLDAARLVRCDLPPGWKMTVDDRMGVMGPEPTGRRLWYHDEIMPSRVTNDRGEDVTASVRGADLVAAPVGEIDSRFIGMLVRDHGLTMEFARPIAGEHSPVEGSGARQPILVIDGWIEYPYSQTSFAAWQAKAAYRAPSVEARGADGRWHMVLEQFGYPAGMPRQMAVPLPMDKLPQGTRELRITTNQEVYFDRIAIAFAEDCPQAVVHGMKPSEARLLQSGFARRTTGPQRQPSYDYEQRVPLWDTRYQPGWYTALGPCTELIAAKDDALAIFGPGEEIHMEFEADEPALPPGWTRRYVLELDGWCKDMDLFTKDGESLAPLPGEANAVREKLHEQYNTRFESGR